MVSAAGHIGLVMSPIQTTDNGATWIIDMKSAKWNDPCAGQVDYQCSLGEGTCTNVTRVSIRVPANSLAVTFWTNGSGSTPTPPVSPTATQSLTPAPTNTPDPCAPVWSVASFTQPSGYNGLFDISASSANDVWAVGFSGGYYYWATLTEHWDGVSWSVVPSPDPGYSQLYGVWAESANDVWAVGTYYLGGYRTLVEHWDGSTWSIVPNPNPPSVRSSLSQVWRYRPMTYGLWERTCLTGTVIEHLSSTGMAVLGALCPIQAWARMTV